MGYFAPRSIEEALQILARNTVTVVAGGTDIFPAQTGKLPKNDLLDLTKIKSLAEIERVEGGLRIGAGVRWSDLLRADLPPSFNGLKSAASKVGALQVQNAGTIGGNLCNASPAADGVPALLVLDAEVELASGKGQRHLPLSDFITGVRKTALGPDEIMTAIHIPEPPENSVGSFLKHGSRTHLVISIAMTSALVWQDSHGRVAGARIAVGSCSPVAQRLPALEDMLLGLPVSQINNLAIKDTHLAPLSPISDLRGSAEYRISIAKVLCQRALILAVNGEATDG